MARAASCQIGNPLSPLAQRCGGTQQNLAPNLYVLFFFFSRVSASSDFLGDEARLSSILRVDPFSLPQWVFLKTDSGGSERFNIREAASIRATCLSTPL